MKRVSTAVAGILASVLWWSAAGAIDTSILPQAGGWNGFYVGVNAGYARTTARWTDQFGFTTGDFPGEGSLLGFTAGYNWQNGNWVYGVEGDLSRAKLKAESFSFTCFPLNCETEFRSLATLRARLGYLYAPNVLVFGTAGLAAANLNHGNFLFTSAQNTGVGFAVGTGIEARIAPQWSVKAEYIFTKINGGEACDAATCLITIDNDKLNTHVFRLGLNWHANPGGARQMVNPVMGGWGGYYAGVLFGYAKTKSEWSDSLGFKSGEFDGSGGTMGVNVGVNWQSGRWVYGVETDASFAKIESGFDSACLCILADNKIEHLFTARGRIGYLVMPNALVYATGGVAGASIKYSFLFAPTRTSFEVAPAVGAGVEFRFAKDWSVKGEYLYIAFGDSLACGSLCFPLTLTSDYFDVQIFRLGINRYF